MNKKAIIAVLSALVLTVVASVTLILTVGQKASADTGEANILVIDDWDDFVIYTDTYDGSECVYCDGFSDQLYTKLGISYIACGNWHDYNNIVTQCDEIHIKIPAGVQSLNGFVFDAFNSVGSLSKITCIELPNTLKSIYSLDALGYYRLSGLTNIEIPSSVTDIGSRAFAGCTGLTSITVPSSVTSIGDCAFYYCEGLSEITIPNSVTSIGGGAFCACTGLTSVEIPASVESMGSWVFEDCYSLAVINCECSEEYAREHWDEGFDSGCDAEFVWDYVPTYTVTFNENGIDSQTINKNGNAVEPAEPTREGYEFKYWYTDDENVAFDFANTPITKNISLSAHWEAIPESTEPEVTNPETPSEQENTETVKNENNNKTLALGIAGGSVAGLGAISAVVAIIIAKKRRK